MKLPPVPTPLQHATRLIEEFSAPCVGFSLQKLRAPGTGRSKIGGMPDLPKNFVWPTNKGRKLDFVLQVNLAEASPFDETDMLPKDGLLSFFYDLDNQPWGFDPKNLEGFRVIHTPDGTPLQKTEVPDAEYTLLELAIVCRSALSLPYPGSSDFERLNSRTQFTDDEEDVYREFSSRVASDGSENPKDGHHRLLGHSENIQGDMKLQAQLVTNGLYCGNSSGYQDPRRKTLEKGADDWVLLLQLDSDDTGEFMWGDSGMLYYWIRREDLAERRFDKVWMTLQCC